MPVTNTPALALEHVRFAYDGQNVLEDITATIDQGAYAAIVGPNGGGKTTMLKLMLGLLTPTSGSVKMFGLSPFAARKQGKIGYVPQRIVQSDFEFPATVEEIVRSGRSRAIGIGRMGSKADTAIIEKTMKKAGIAHLRNRRISALSGGERQKVFIARALASEPDILILDEPTTGVDSASQEEFYALLRTLNRKEGITILFVSHDIEIMAKEASTLLCLNCRLVAHCDGCDFMHSKAAKDLYGTSVGHIHHHHAH